jgi:hypothetical protein
MIEIGFDKGTAMDIINGELFGAIKTRGGFPVRVLAWDVKSRYCIAGVVQMGDDECVKQWTADGKADYRRNVTSSLDLVLQVEGGEE